MARALRHRRLPIVWIVGGFFAVVLVVGVVLWLRESTADRDSQKLLTTEVIRTSFTVAVLDQGTLESAENVNHYCEVEGRSGGRDGGTTILWVIPEGSQVEQGDLIVELDTAYLQEMIQAQEIALRDAESSLARINTEVESAKKAVKEYEEGTFISEKRSLEANLTLVEEQLRRARQYLAYSKRLHARGFITSLQLEADQFAVERLKIELDKAQRDLEILSTVTKEKNLAYLHGDLESKLATQKAEADKLSQEKERLSKYRKQLEKCKIYAQADGMIVYYEPPGRWGPDEEEKIRAGAVVRERKNLIIIPDLSKMRLRMMVHESKIDMVRTGQKVNIRVDAFPDRPLTGEVEMVGTAPAPGPWYDRDKRNYPVVVQIENPIEGLKPGMTAQGEIVVQRLLDVVAVPIQCIHSVGDQAFCDVQNDGGKRETRQVKLGPTNDVLIQVKSGLRPGERVIQSAFAGEETVGNEESPRRDAPLEGEAEEDKEPPPHATQEADEEVP